MGNIEMNLDKELRISSMPENLGQVEKLIDELSERCSLASDMYGKVLVACIEAVNNSIIHGNKSNPDKFVNIEVKSNKEKLRIVVQDEGVGFDFSNLPDPTAPENIERINGRGVFLMNHLSDQVNFFKEGSGVEMIFNIA